jgi:hypothetical protein
MECRPPQAYVEMLAILVLGSERARAYIVGEDLVWRLRRSYSEPGAESDAQNGDRRAFRKRRGMLAT